MGEVCVHHAQLERSFAFLSLQLNHSKCEISILNSPRGAMSNVALAEVRRTMPGIVKTATNSLILFCSPLGDDALHASLAGCIDKIELKSGRLKNLVSQWALFFQTK